MGVHRTCRQADEIESARRSLAVERLGAVVGAGGDVPEPRGVHAHGKFPRVPQGWEKRRHCWPPVQIPQRLYWRLLGQGQHEPLRPGRQAGVLGHPRGWGRVRRLRFQRELGRAVVRRLSRPDCRPRAALRCVALPPLLNGRRRKRQRGRRLGAVLGPTTPAPRLGPRRVYRTHTQVDQPSCGRTATSMHNGATALARAAPGTAPPRAVARGLPKVLTCACVCHLERRSTYPTTTHKVRQGRADVHGRPERADPQHGLGLLPARRLTVTWFNRGEPPE